MSSALLALGSLLLLIAAIGGGFEVKEIKVPRVGAGSRALSLMLGMLMLLLAAVGEVDEAAAGATSPVPAQQASQSPGQAFAAVPAPEAPAPAPSRSEGYVGRRTFSYEAEGTLYRYALEATGRTGKVHVAYTDAEGKEGEVIQDLELRELQNGARHYVGLNPSDPATGVRVDWAEAFHIRVGEAGEWSVSQVCDATGCYPATSLEA